MNDKVFWAGMLSVFASIVGGGLEALGVKIPVLKEKGPRFALGILGMLLIVVTKWASIEQVLPPYGPALFVSQPVLLHPDEQKTLHFNVGRPGRLDASLTEFVPQWPEGMRHSGSPGLSVSICQTEEVKPCQSFQRGADQELHQSVSTGPATVSFYNFGSNPPILFTPKVSYPRQAILHLPESSKKE